MMGDKSSPGIPWAAVGGKWLPIVGFLLLSTLAWSWLVIAAPPSYTRYVRAYSDHFSHYMSGLLFWHKGARIWSEPIEQICGPQDLLQALVVAEEWQVSERDICFIPERQGQRPLVINWIDFPRPYPPGFLLYTLPEALLYAGSSLSFAAINTIEIVQFLVVAHGAVFLLWLVLWGEGGERPAGGGWRVMTVLVLALAYTELVWWALCGIYDSVAIAAVILAFWGATKKRWLWTILAFSSAVFLHFRALWYLPLLFLAGYRQVRDHGMRLTAKEWLGVGGAAILLVAAGASFLLVFPSLWQFPLTNPANLKALGEEPGLWFGLVGIPFLSLLLFLAYKRDWLLCGLLGWQLFMLVNVRQTMGWHTSFLLPMFAAGRWQGGRTRHLAAVFIGYCLEAVAMGQPLPVPVPMWRVLTGQ